MRAVRRFHNMGKRKGRVHRLGKTKRAASLPLPVLALFLVLDFYAAHILEHQLAF